MSISIYAKLFNNTVIPVTDYAAGVWGYKNFDDHNKLQHRAIRTLLGVGKQTSLVALDGETGLISPLNRRHNEIIRLWHRLARLPISRIAHRILVWDIHKTEHLHDTWSADVKHILEDNNLLNFFNIDATKRVSCDYLLNCLRASTNRKLEISWLTDVQHSPKLRTYKLLKSSYASEPYLDRQLSIKQRSALARFRCGVFPISIELGRYRRPQIPLERRLCLACNHGHIEDETHFLASCTVYDDLRQQHFGDVTLTGSVTDLFKSLMASDPKHIANFLIEAYDKRNRTLKDRR